MAQILLRFEKPVALTKTVPAHTLYIEFHLEQKNSVRRLWNVMKNNRPQALKEQENFGTPELLKGYVKNMRGLYEKQGFKAVSGEWLAQTAPSKKSDKSKPAPEPETVPSAPKADLGALPADALE